MRSRLHPYLLLLACCAVLFNLLAMPLDRALREPPLDESLIFGSFCSLHGGQSLPKSVLAQLKLELPDFSGHGGIKPQAGDCCCGHTGQAALPGAYFKHLLPRFWPDALLLGQRPELPLPRQQWPNLTPRAPPLT